MHTHACVYVYIYMCTHAHSHAYVDTQKFTNASKMETQTFLSEMNYVGFLLYVINRPHYLVCCL